MLETGGLRTSGGLWSRIHPDVVRGETSPCTQPGPNPPFPSAERCPPPIFTPVISSDVNREPAAAQLHWLLTTNDLIPSINKA